MPINLTTCYILLSSENIASHPNIGWPVPGTGRKNLPGVIDGGAVLCPSAGANRVVSEARIPKRAHEGGTAGSRESLVTYCL